MIKPVRLFPKLHDISEFVLKTVPNYNPSTRDYEKFWTQEERFCVEGKWGKDGDKWRYCPATLYFYVNYTVIEDLDKKSKAVKRIRPKLRDIDWYLNYCWLVCRGFSGFENDEQHTCNLVVKKMEANVELSPEDEIIFERSKDTLYHNGQLKKYIEPREYLFNGVDSPKGRPLYHNTSLNLFVLSTRGLGKSWWAANAVIYHEFLFCGKKYYEDYVDTTVQGSEVFVGSALASKSSELLAKFEVSFEHNKGNNGSFGSGKAFEPGFFFRNTSGVLSPNNGKNPFTQSYEVKEGGVLRNLGTQSKIIHGTFTSENPDAAVGSRPSVIVVEEVGLMGNIQDVHAANENCQFRTEKFGSSLYIGTGGNIEKIHGCETMFYSPGQYGFLGFPDVFENRPDHIGLFIPAYYANSAYVDEQGNTDIERSFVQESIKRRSKESSRNSALEFYKMYNPFTHSEMFLSKKSFIFPTARLRDRLFELEHNKVWERNAMVGELEWADLEKKSVKWIVDNSAGRFKDVITSMDLGQLFNTEGRIVIYEHPGENIPNPTHNRSLYKVTYDVIKDDHGGLSLASVLVYKGTTDKWNDGLQNTIVAEWIGRYDSVNDCHIIALKLALYYNAKILVENNIPNFITYCKMQGYYHMLQRCPIDAIKDYVKEPSKKWEVGVTMNEALNISCEQLGRQYLLEPYRKLEDKMLVNIDNLYSIRLIVEFLAYDRVINCDHVSSFKLLMLWLSQEKKTIFKEESPEDPLVKDLKQLTQNRKIVNTHTHDWFRY